MISVLLSLSLCMLSVTHDLISLIDTAYREVAWICCQKKQESVIVCDQQMNGV